MLVLFFGFQSRAIVKARQKKNSRDRGLTRVQNRNIPRAGSKTSKFSSAWPKYIQNWSSTVETYLKNGSKLIGVKCHRCYAHGKSQSKTKKIFRLSTYSLTFLTQNENQSSNYMTKRFKNSASLETQFSFVSLNNFILIKEAFWDIT